MIEIKVVRNVILNNIDIHDQPSRLHRSLSRIRQNFPDSWAIQDFLSHFRPFFCSSLHSYRKRIRLIPGPISLFVEGNLTPTFLLSFASNISDWKWPMGTSAPFVGILLVPISLISHLFFPLLLNPILLTGIRVRVNHHHLSIFAAFTWNCLGHSLLRARDPYRFFSMTEPLLSIV